MAKLIPSALYLLSEEKAAQGSRAVHLAYINHRLCGRDNGRVLGYDNSHGGHHRHYMGSVEPIEFDSYDMIVERFETELAEMWRKEDEDTKG